MNTLCFVVFCVYIFQFLQVVQLAEVHYIAVCIICNYFFSIMAAIGESQEEVRNHLSISC